MAEFVEDPYSIPRVVGIVSSLLQSVADHNDIAHNYNASKASSSSSSSALASPFQGLSKPSISVRSYLERIFRYANCSPSCYVVAYIYMDRFLLRHKSVAIDSFNVHRFIITSVLTAVKFMDDIYYNNAYFAKVGGISLMEMNYLEVDFLFGVGFQLNVTPLLFTSYCSILQKEIYMECPPPPPKFLCSFAEEEPNSCHQKQIMNVPKVFST